MNFKITEFNIYIPGERRKYVNYCNKVRKKEKGIFLIFIFQAIKHTTKFVKRKLPIPENFAKILISISNIIV